LSSGTGLELDHGNVTLAANAGNGHTLAAIISGGAIAGLVEHHTSRLDADSFTRIVNEFAAGRLSNDSVFEDGGHGCLPPTQPVNIDADNPVILTGPRRDVFREAALPVELAAPHGDMMLTGCFGLVGAYLKLV
jgi:uncharacterized protein (DUF1786 family)